jgi:mannonate dehydratase
LPIHAASGTPIAADRVWENYAAFVRAMMPVAEQAGVRLALHPDDPPIPELLGVSRIFHHIKSFERAYDLVPSQSNGVTFCQANFALMPGNVADHARQLANRIAFVHWRDVAGTATDFHETFHDDGPHDMAATVRLYHELGFTGPIRLDHAPLTHGEPTPWMPGYGNLGRTHAAAYLRGICHASAIELV